MIYAEKVALERVTKDLDVFMFDLLRRSKASKDKGGDGSVTLTEAIILEVSRPIEQARGIALAGFPTTQEIQEMRTP